MKFIQAMLLLFVLPQLVAAQTIDTMGLRARTRFLSADILRGRGTGSAGERIAAEYIASELTRIGVPPVANGSYFQKVPHKRAVIATAALRFNGTTYGAGDFVWNTGGRAAFHNSSTCPSSQDASGPAVNPAPSASGAGSGVGRLHSGKELV